MNDYDYIIDAFTRDGDNTNLEVNNLEVGCITSNNNNFSLDSNGNLTVNSVTTQSINQQAIYNSIYPVGSIYLSINNTNPGTLFGGVWEQIKDKFLLSAGDVHTAGDTGGSENHRHDFMIGLYCNWHEPIADSLANAGAYSYSQSKFAKALQNFDNRSLYANANHALSTSSSQVTGTLRASKGDTDLASSMPPYVAVYMWKRIS